MALILMNSSYKLLKILIVVGGYRLVDAMDSWNITIILIYSVGKPRETTPMNG